MFADDCRMTPDERESGLYTYLNSGLQDKVEYDLCLYLNGTSINKPKYEIKRGTQWEDGADLARRRNDLDDLYNTVF